MTPLNILILLVLFCCFLPLHTRVLFSGSESLQSWSHVSWNYNETFLFLQVSWRGKYVSNCTRLNIWLENQHWISIYVYPPPNGISRNKITTTPHSPFDDSRPQPLPIPVVLQQHQQLVWEDVTDTPMAELYDLLRLKVGWYVPKQVGKFWDPSILIQVDTEDTAAARIRNETSGVPSTMQQHSFLRTRRHSLNTTVDETFTDWKQWSSIVIIPSLVPPMVRFYYMARLESLRPATTFVCLIGLLLFLLPLWLWRQFQPLKSRGHLPIVYVILQLCYLLSSTFPVMYGSFVFLQYNCLLVWWFQYSVVIVSLCLTLLHFVRYMILMNVEKIKWDLAIRDLEYSFTVPVHYRIWKFLGKWYISLMIGSVLWLALICASLFVFLSFGQFQCNTESILIVRIIYNALILFFGGIAIIILLWDSLKHLRYNQCKRFFVSDNYYFRAEIYLFYFSLLALFGITSIWAFVFGGFGNTLGSALRNTVLCNALLFPAIFPLLFAIRERERYFKTRERVAKWFKKCCNGKKTSTISSLSHNDNDNENDNDGSHAQLRVTEPEIQNRQKHVLVYSMPQRKHCFCCLRVQLVNKKFVTNPYSFGDAVFKEDENFDPFARGEYSIENLACFRDICRYKNADTNRKYQYAKAIIDRYLQEDSPLEVNVPTELICPGIIGRIERKEYDNDLFATLEREIKSNLYDTFSRYALTDDFIIFVETYQKKDREFYNFSRQLSTVFSDERINRRTVTEVQDAEDDTELFVIEI